MCKKPTVRQRRGLSLYLVIALTKSPQDVMLVSGELILYH